MLAEPHHIWHNILKKSLKTHKSLPIVIEHSFIYLI